jgi:hypothetical protein
MGLGDRCPVCMIELNGHTLIPVSGHEQCSGCGFVVANCCEGASVSEINRVWRN